MTDLLASYRAAGPGHDEMLQSTGAAREAWAQLADLADLNNSSQLARRAQEVAELVEDNGVSIGPEQRPWRLDPLPVLLDEHDWSRLETGLQQRAVLLDHILTDLYGAGELLSSGLLPPALVLGQAGFIRAAADIRTPGPRQLFMAGTDLARNADGSWQVLSDRTQAPIGMGYAMQDRRIIAEVLSGLYRRARIRRLGPFFQAMRQAISQVAPAGAGESPRAVLLTPGPFSPSAFDQAYLATMLGYPLVEGEDLVVTDGRLWMRSLGRLEPVDVVLRHVEAADCDPLDLRGDSRLGVPGLVEAARTGAVTVVNGFGSGALENPGLLTYLPRVCRSVLGEELLIPSTVTYWCGERSMCSHVIANLDRLVVRATQPGAAPIRGWHLSRAERADLSVRIATEPHLWVGQERVEPSTTPAVAGARLEARPTQLRTFAVAARESYQVMSGGVARIAVEGTDVVGPPEGDVAKDVWVLGSQPYTVSAPWVTEHAGSLTAHPASGISPGAARDLFWFGRYAERAEGTARLVRAVSDRWSDFGTDPTSTDPTAAHRHSDGVAALGVLTRVLGSRYGHGTLSNLVLDPKWEASVAFSVSRLARCATSVRDQLSPDTWAALSPLERALSWERRRQEREGTLGGNADVAPIAGRVLERLLAISGILAESMVRDVGWFLLDAGRRVERAQQVVDVLQAAVTTQRDPAVDTLVLESVLIGFESVITYRRRYQSHASVSTVLDLVLNDPQNPRSLRFQLTSLAADLAQVPPGPRPASARDALLADLLGVLDELDTRTVTRAEAGGRRGELAQALDAMSWRLRELAEEIARVHFSHTASAPWLDASGTFAADGTPPQPNHTAPQPNHTAPQQDHTAPHPNHTAPQQDRSSSPNHLEPGTAGEES